MCGACRLRRRRSTPHSFGELSKGPFLVAYLCRRVDGSRFLSYHIAATTGKRGKPIGALQRLAEAFG